MTRATFIVSIACWVTLGMWARAQPQQPSPGSSPASQTHRAQLDSDAASALILQKSALKYPEAARRTGLQGIVVLRVVVGISSNVQEVSVVSGDPALAQSAADTVKLWKYKPYLVEGLPAEFETEVSVNFQIKTPPPPTPPPLGNFRDDAYTNDFFDIHYPLSRDWVRQTDLMRTKLASEGNNKSSYVLLAEVYIPHDSDPSRADSSFLVLAIHRSGPEDCKHYLEASATAVQSRKEAKQKGDITEFTVAGHDFFRVDFEYRQGIDHRTFLCTSIKDYFLQWNIIGWSKQAIENAVATLSTMTPATPGKVAEPQPPASIDGKSVTTKVKVQAGISSGLLVKKVAPVYPGQARHDRIQGTVTLQAVISKTGDITDLEALSGPMELVPSAVNAVRQWKYRPYLLNGEPVFVETQIQVNYMLSF